MEYVNLGSAGLKVSRLCLGTMTYGSKRWREWVLEETEALPFYRRALEAGINFFDSADMYSLGVRHLDQAIEALNIRLTEDEMKALEEPYEAHPVPGH
jgi:aryl-alcohol dehydrogenase-like predicted oxidoreductase